MAADRLGHRIAARPRALLPLLLTCAGRRCGGVRVLQAADHAHRPRALLPPVRHEAKAELASGHHARPGRAAVGFRFLAGRHDEFVAAPAAARV